PYTTLMPAFASSVLNVGPEGYGLLMSSSGLGAVVGALSVASLGKGTQRGRLMLGSVAVLGASLVVFGLSHLFLLSLLVLVITGATSMAYSSLNQTYLQTLAADEMRGRVMSLLTVATFGVQPLGTLAMGTIGEYIGESPAVFGGGLICLLYALWLMATNPRVRGLR
ncbi:MAG: MFS transporter, partial [Chloroflexi bacterium]|nr:MFS transporter [Chloroflexota bacterium]